MCVYFDQKMYICGVKPCKKHQNYGRQITRHKSTRTLPSTTGGYDQQAT